MTTHVHLEQQTWDLASLPLAGLPLFLRRVVDDETIRISLALSLSFCLVLSVRLR